MCVTVAGGKCVSFFCVCGVVNFFVTNLFLCVCGGGGAAGVENNSGEIDGRG